MTQMYADRFVREHAVHLSFRARRRSKPPPLPVTVVPSNSRGQRDGTGSKTKPRSNPIRVPSHQAYDNSSALAAR